jgi:hypothetical protein
MKKLFVLFVLVGIMTFASLAQATSITYELDFEFSGGASPKSDSPWAIATFDDHDGTGAVTLTMQSSLGFDEILTLWYFNFDTSTFNINELDFEYDNINSTGPPVQATDGITVGDNFKNVAGGGNFDIAFDFPPPPGNADMFDGTETVIYEITSTEAIDASAFDIFSTGGGNGMFKTAAHIQRIDPDNQFSGWIGPDEGSIPPTPPIPEPSTLFLLGIGLMGILGLGRKLKK